MFGRAILGQARGQLLCVLVRREALLGVEVAPGAQGSWCASGRPVVGIRPERNPHPCQAFGPYLKQKTLQWTP